MSQGGWREHPEARAEFLAESNRLPVDVAAQFISHAENAIDEVLRSPDA